MEGPSIVIATEELKKFYKKTPLNISAQSAELKSLLESKKFLSADHWGKHLILHFSKTYLRIHFLMFGSYRIDNPRENRIPKLKLEFENGTVYFYSCAIKEISTQEYKDYDGEIDLMGEDWKNSRAVTKLKKYSEGMVCDLLMDQTIFAGLGNIMKNEILFLLKMHPETKIKELSEKRLKELVKASQKYAWQFYEWKNQGVLKKNWQIFRKKKCPECGKAVTKKPTGKGKRMSHFCKNDQLKL